MKTSIYKTKVPSDKVPSLPILVKVHIFMNMVYSPPELSMHVSWTAQHQFGYILRTEMAWNYMCHSAIHSHPSNACWERVPASSFSCCLMYLPPLEVWVFLSPRKYSPIWNFVAIGYVGFYIFEEHAASLQLLAWYYYFGPIQWVK